MASALSENPASVIHSLNLAHNTLDNQGSVLESVNSFSLPLPSLSWRRWLFSCSGFCLRSKNSKSIPVLTEPSFFCFALYFSFFLLSFSSHLSFIMCVYECSSSLEKMLLFSVSPTVLHTNSCDLLPFLCTWTHIKTRTFELRMPSPL